MDRDDNEDALYGEMRQLLLWVGGMVADSGISNSEIFQIILFYDENAFGSNFLFNSHLSPFCENC